MVKFWSEIIRDEELYNLNQPMNLSFYQTVTKSINNSAKYNDVLQNSPYLATNVLNIDAGSSLPSRITSSIEGKNLETKPINLNEYTNVMFTTLYTKDIIDNPSSDEVTEAIDSVKNLSDVNEHWLLLNLNSLDTYKSDKASKSSNLILSSNVEETVRFYRKKSGTHDPVTIRPSYISDSSLESIKNRDSGLFYLKMPTHTGDIEPKPKLHENFLVRKQKRYKVRKKITPKKFTLSRKVIKGLNDIIVPGSEKIEPVMKETKAKLLINRDRSIDMPTNGETPTLKYKVFKLNKKKTDSVNLNVNRRMLRTRRTLVLPAHVNITAVTNSFDVIHSWFIPGLGLKMDCIPGRATHHTFYIDNVGFYYGQCAEVCGRYHHHMPIRICALPFDHFLLWWHHFGARRFLNPVVNKPGDFVDQLKKESA